jgi:predicted nucleic acid-binding protein
MTDLVIDSSVAIKWFVPEPYSNEARRILDGYRSGALSFLAPDLINAEFGNIVWKKRMFQGLGADDAEAVITEFGKVSLAITPTAGLLEEAYRLAVAHQRTVYDSLYLALAIRESCQFVTADERLANALSSAQPTVVWLGSWP